jgi:hypothetical protein
VCGLRTNSDYFSISPELIGFYKRDKGCLLRGWAWGFKSDGYNFVPKELIRYFSKTFMLTNIPSSNQEHFQGRGIFYSFVVSVSGFGDDEDVEPYQMVNFPS